MCACCDCAHKNEDDVPRRGDCACERALDGPRPEYYEFTSVLLTRSRVAVAARCRRAVRRCSVALLQSGPAAVRTDGPERECVVRSDHAAAPCCDDGTARYLLIPTVALVLMQRGPMALSCAIASAAVKEPSDAMDTHAVLASLMRCCDCDVAVSWRCAVLPAGCESHRSRVIAGAVPFPQGAYHDPY